MDYAEYRAAAVAALSKRSGWTTDEADAILGDVSDMHAEGETPEQAAQHVYDASLDLA